MIVENVKNDSFVGWLLKLQDNSNAKTVDSVLVSPPFIIYFVHQVVPAVINSSQLKPNNHDFLKLLFRSCKVENIYVHKLVGFDRAIYVILVSSNSESHRQFSLFDTEIWPNAKNFEVYSAKMSSFMCKNEIFKA